MNDATQQEARRVIRSIGIALNACHNTVTTDDPDAQPDEKCWRIDNSKEIDDLDILARMLGISTDTDL